MGDSPIRSLPQSSPASPSERLYYLFRFNESELAAIEPARPLEFREISILKLVWDHKEFLLAARYLLISTIDIIFNVPFVRRTTRLYAALNEHRIVHYSFVRRRARVTSFLQRNDIEIGPCRTRPDFRRNGILVRMLAFISGQLAAPGRSFWLIVRANNFPMIAALRSIQLVPVARAARVAGFSGIFHQYKSIEDHDRFPGQPSRSISNNDKRTEQRRYNERAKSALAQDRVGGQDYERLGALAIPVINRAPYICYEAYIKKFVRENARILELGAGIGDHSAALVGAGGRVVCSDISLNSLQVLRKRMGAGVCVCVSDMEMLPFVSSSFDVVACAGSLSYGDADLVDAEVRRVLRPGGVFLCVDTLNHNPIFRFNRWLHFLRGLRTKSTLVRMPTLERIRSISRGFQELEVRYFGSITYLLPLLASTLGEVRAASISNWIDRVFRVKGSAFKFVIAVKGRL